MTMSHDSMICVRSEYIHNDTVVALEDGPMIGHALEKEKVSSAVRRLSHAIQFADSYLFEEITATKIRLRYRCAPHTWMSIIMGEDDDRYELKVRDFVITYEGTADELRLLHELLYWYNEFGDASSTSQLDAIKSVWCDKTPEEQSLLPQIILQFHWMSCRNGRDGYILGKYGVTNNVFKLLNANFRRGMMSEIEAASQLWRENSMGMNYGQFLTYLFTTKSASKAA